MTIAPPMRGQPPKWAAAVCRSNGPCGTISKRWWPLRRRSTLLTIGLGVVAPLAPLPAADSLRGLAAQVGGLEAVAQPPDAVDIAPAAGVDAVFENAGEALVIGGERQLRIA